MNTECPIKEWIWRASVLVGLAALLSGVCNAVSPAGISWSGREALGVGFKAAKYDIDVVDLDEAARILEAGEVVVLDARSTDHYVSGHLPGALSLPIAEVEEHFGALQILLVPEQPVLVYCSGAACDESLRLGQFLRQQGIERVALFEGGMEAWLKAQMPVEQGE